MKRVLLLILPMFFAGCAVKELPPVVVEAPGRDIDYQREVKPLLAHKMKTPRNVGEYRPDGQLKRCNELFIDSEWLQPPHLVGFEPRLSGRILEWLSAPAMAKARIIHCGNYDPVGLR